MTLSAKNNNNNNKSKGDDLDVPVKGTHKARLVGLTDLGHQPSWEYKGETVKDQFKITFTYELVGSFMADGRPHFVSEDINVNDFEPTKGKEGQRPSNMMLRVRAIDVENESQNGQDLSTMLGKPCMVTVGHKESGYTKVAGVTGVAIGETVGELTNPIYSFDMNNPDLITYNGFSDFVKGKIEKALNFESSGLKDKLESYVEPY